MNHPIFHLNETAPKPSEMLKEALALLGPNGENWIRCSLHRTIRDWRWLWLKSHHLYCSLGAVAEVNTVNQTTAENYLADASYKLCGRSIVAYNDTLAQDFSDIKKMFNLAIELAEANGQ